VAKKDSNRIKLNIQSHNDYKNYENVLQYLKTIGEGKNINVILILWTFNECVEWELNLYNTIFDFELIFIFSI